jgi:hypothetical protein
VLVGLVEDAEPDVPCGDRAMADGGWLKLEGDERFRK